MSEATSGAVSRHRSPDIASLIRATSIIRPSIPSASTSAVSASVSITRPHPGQFGDAAVAELHHVDRLHRAQHRLRILRATAAPDRWRHADSGRAPRYRAPAAASARHAPAADSRSVLRARAAAATPTRRRRSSISPSDGINPASARNSVVLPAPFGPTSATRCPADSASETSFSTTRPASRTPSPLAVSRAASLMRRLRRARGARA